MLRSSAFSISPPYFREIVGGNEFFKKRNSRSISIDSAATSWTGWQPLLGTALILLITGDTEPSPPQLVLASTADTLLPTQDVLSLHW